MAEPVGVGRIQECVTRVTFPVSSIVSLVWLCQSKMESEGPEVQASGLRALHQVIPCAVEGVVSNSGQDTVLPGGEEMSCGKRVVASGQSSKLRRSS